jgi:hypothetical protein
MLFKIISFIIILLLLFSDIQQIKNKIKQMLKK